ETTQSVLTAAPIAFEDKYKWTLTDATNTFHANIEDPGFRDADDKGAVDFTAHDALRNRLHTTTRRGPSGRLITEHAVTEVLEVIPGPRPTQLLINLGDKEKP